MKDELVSFDTAKLTKEKGFDWKVWESYYKMTFEEVWKPNSGNNTNKYDHFKNWNYETYIARPTQSLLQRWLREVHNIHILMNVGMNDGIKQTFYCNVFIFGKNLYDGKFRSKTSVYTYEQALEEGLLEALKLI